jgi:transposase
LLQPCNRRVGDAGKNVGKPCLRIDVVDVHANQIKQWRDQLLEGATGVFGDEAKTEPAGPTVDVKTLHAQIGELTLENDFLSGALGKAGLLGGKK